MSQIIWHKKDLIWLLGGVLLAALVIYLTPLKNLNMIEPRIKDVPPAEFYKDFSVNPEKYVFIIFSSTRQSLKTFFQSFFDAGSRKSIRRL